MANFMAQQRDYMSAYVSTWDQVYRKCPRAPSIKEELIDRLHCRPILL